jgi:hypothetical protein
MVLMMCLDSIPLVRLKVVLRNSKNATTKAGYSVPYGGALLFIISIVPECLVQEFKSCRRLFKSQIALALWTSVESVGKCRKLTHTNLFVSACHHHATNKQAVLFILTHRAKVMCDSNSLLQELKCLHQTFWDSGCSEWQILQAPNSLMRASPQHKKDYALVAFLLFVGITLNCISKVLSKHNIRMVGSPANEALQLSLTYEGSSGSENARCLQHTL